MGLQGKRLERDESENKQEACALCDDYIVVCLFVVVGLAC